MARSLRHCIDGPNDRELEPGNSGVGENGWRPTPLLIPVPQESSYRASAR
ncbi:hypothetical protein GGI59_003197 [Rhizobium lentis]|uniref:Uncharacterized protein n=1 Tax=Rhizobium lentis TaxID=1138194 RepID=A0A7W8UNZ5_9HYPH|nr:hypothetical protein [Rhizobium lentis]MBB5561521.1 hypothetical protein [Rhizobium lentis]MBB5568105.1 hypothetical protein [Rhizobium lentis]